MLKKIFGCSAVILIILCLYAGLAYGDDLKTGVITGNMVNVRQNPAITGDNIITQLVKGTKVSILSVSGDWTKVQFNDLTGWINNDFIKATNEVLGTGTVTTEILNLRSTASLTSDVVTKLEKGDKVSIILKSGDWYKVKTSDGNIGWVFGDFISLGNQTSSRGDDVRSGEETSDSTADSADTADTQATLDLRQQIVDYAKKFVGCDYDYGGSTPSGFDCSGFTSYVYRHFGIELERTSGDQSQEGTRVTKDNLKPGDLVFFDTNGGHNSINHVAIYIGNGKIVHAESERYGVNISDLSEAYYLRTYMKARRIID